MEGVVEEEATQQPGAGLGSIVHLVKEQLGGPTKFYVETDVTKIEVWEVIVVSVERTD